jgi:hypothetical protein
MSINISGKKITGITPRTAQVFDTSGSHTWKRPEGCKFIRVQLVGGGGGSAGYVESGGAGGYSEKYMDVRNLSQVSVTVGGGGATLTYYGNASDGGTTSFGTYLTATGGYGANRNVQHEGGRGGIGSGGDVNLFGGKGAGHANGCGSWGPNRGGISYFGGPSGRRHSDNANNTGEQNAAPGAGGSGGKTDATTGGGPGMPGIVIVHEYY